MYTLDMRRILSCCYADAGVLVARDPILLQQTFDSLYALFHHVRLKTNATKTEVMVILPR